MDDLNKLFALIAERCDPDEIVDILGYSSARLCVVLRKEIINNREKFEEFLDVFEQDEKYWLDLQDEEEDYDA